ncbi:MAG TPA: hypothetical protein VEI02_13995 [Planctomycetota bacterium]|nr:hypothetical protein [Planctomycetota bacterium]
MVTLREFGWERDFGGGDIGRGARGGYSAGMITAHIAALLLASFQAAAPAEQVVRIRVDDNAQNPFERVDVFLPAILSAIATAAVAVIAHKTQMSAIKRTAAEQRTASAADLVQRRRDELRTEYHRWFAALARVRRMGEIACAFADEAAARARGGAPLPESELALKEMEMLRLHAEAQTLSDALSVLDPDTERQDLVGDLSARAQWGINFLFNSQARATWRSKVQFSEFHEKRAKLLDSLHRLAARRD